jgi:hypothetical protein
MATLVAAVHGDIAADFVFVVVVVVVVIVVSFCVAWLFTRYKDAAEDMDKLRQMYPNDKVVEHKYEKACFEIRKKNRVDYYALLQVGALVDAALVSSYSAYVPGKIFPLLSLLLSARSCVRCPGPKGRFDTRN